MSHKDKKISPFKKYMYETMKILSEKEEDEESSDDSEDTGDNKDVDDPALEDTSDQDDSDKEGNKDPDDKETDDLDIEQELEPRATDTIVDNEILRHLAKAEQAGLTVAAQEEQQNKKFGIDKNVKETFVYKKSLIKLLLEEDDPDSLNKSEIILDVETYAFNVARLIKNYMNLLDMEKTIFTKAHNYLKDKYSSEVADNFDEIMANNHGISFKPEQNIPDVYAVGAYSTQQA